MLERCGRRRYSDSRPGAQKKLKKRKANLEYLVNDWVSFRYRRVSLLLASLAFTDQIIRLQVPILFVLQRKNIMMIPSASNN